MPRFAFVCLGLGLWLSGASAWAQTQLINSNVVLVGHLNACVSGPTGTTGNAYTCALDRDITTLQPQVCYGFLADVTNSGPATLNVHGTGAKPLLKVHAGGITPLVANDIRIGQLVHACYDGTAFQCQNCTGNFGQGTPPEEVVTIPAASCSDADVQAAIDSSTTPGDVIGVPAGSCTWNTTVSIDHKRLTLQGAGIGQTIITDNGHLDRALQVTNADASTFVRVTGFSWVQQKVKSSGIVEIGGEQGQVAFRFDHNRILIGTGPARGLYVIGVFGVIDHNTLDVTASTGSVQILTVDGANAGADGGHTPWTQPLTLGTNKAVYVEDNTITYGSEDEDAMDAYTGARLVFRYNTVTRAAIGFHGTDSGGLRSMFSIEQYHNAFFNNGTQTRAGIRYRGGTGVMYNNTFGGSPGYDFFLLMIYRVSVGSSTFSWGYCDGTQWDLGSTNPSAAGSRQVQAAGTGTRWISTAPDTMCSSGVTCTRYFDGDDPKGYPCRDQPGRTHNQALAPIYAWNNGAVTIFPFDGNETPPPNNIGTPLSYWLAANRDYYEFQPGFDGSVGTGHGLLSARPATCTPQVAYWATDTQTLYQCTTPNTWTTYYQPYPYPHPLTVTGPSMVRRR